MSSYNFFSKDLWDNRTKIFWAVYIFYFKISHSSTSIHNQYYSGCIPVNIVTIDFENEPKSSNSLKWFIETPITRKE